jgi:hypothetical protein
LTARAISNTYHSNDGQWYADGTTLGAPSFVAIGELHVLRNRLHRSQELIPRVQQKAQGQAFELARCVPWQVLQETRNQYLEWQEFYFWVRAIMETEGSIPVWLVTRLDEMCPGFTEAERQKATGHAKDVSRGTLLLEEWIERHVFGFAERGGWLPAVTYYAVRDPRYQRASVCWSESAQKWRATKPQEYPSLEQWLLEAARCDESARLEPEIRRQRECFKLVDSARLAEAVSSYMNWEALAYWSRAALHKDPPLPETVIGELDARCPGFLSREATGTARIDGWSRLMVWISDHFFEEAKEQGWYEAIVISARMHPRAIRTMEYADHCDECWKGGVPLPYPPFETWRKSADLYVAP